MARRILLINIAGLGCSTIGEHTPHLRGLAEHGSGVVAVQPPVPALTGPSQATMLTGALPSQHGIVANGWYFPELALILNWQRSARLMQGETLWEAGRARWPGFRCANLFWRYATHSTCDVNVVERPTYWADGRKSEDIYAEPDTVHDELVEALGPFPLFRFWGPAADIASTRGIVDATLHLMQPARFDLLLTYLPHLDYDHQRYGPESPQGVRALPPSRAVAHRASSGSSPGLGATHRRCTRRESFAIPSTRTYNPHSSRGPATRFSPTGFIRAVLRPADDATWSAARMKPDSLGLEIAAVLDSRAAWSSLKP